MPRTSIIIGVTWVIVIWRTIVIIRWIAIIAIVKTVRRVTIIVGTTVWTIVIPSPWIVGINIYGCLGRRWLLVNIQICVMVFLKTTGIDKIRLIIHIERIVQILLRIFQTRLFCIQLGTANSLQIGLTLQPCLLSSLLSRLNRISLSISLSLGHVQLVLRIRCPSEHHHGYSQPKF